MLVAVAEATVPDPDTDVVIEFGFDEPGMRAPVGCTWPEPVKVPVAEASDEMEVSTDPVLRGDDDDDCDVVWVVGIVDDAVRAT